MKLVINTCYGGFGLSQEAYEKLISWGVPVRASAGNEGGDIFVIFDQKLEKGLTEFRRDLTDRYWDNWSRLYKHRSHHLIVRAVEVLGKKANGICSQLKVVEIPDDVQYTIEEYDGAEWVAEKHRTWS